MGEAGDVVKVPTQRKQEVGDWCWGRGVRLARKGMLSGGLAWDKNNSQRCL